MFNLFKKIAISFIAIILVSSQLFLSTSIPSATAFAEGDISLRIDLKEEFFTKSNRMTFDVWARDASDNKIDDDFVTVTNNGNDVDINWSDSVKTSYTVYFEEGINNLHVLVNYDGRVLERAFTITHEPAQDGDIIGEYVFSLDGFSVGLGYIIDPIKLPIIQGDNAAFHLLRALEDHGFQTANTGDPSSGYYLSMISGEKLVELGYPEIPQEIMDASSVLGWAEPDPYSYSPDYGLGEFDFNYMSGWMYAVNNVFPNVGFSDYYLMDEDVMRVQFTIAYGSDIGDDFYSSEEPYFERVSRDGLTEIIATINTTPSKDILLRNDDVRATYEHAYEIIKKMGISQVDLDNAEAQLRSAYEANKVEALIELIDTTRDVSSALYDIEHFSKEELNQVTNLSTLNSTSLAMTTAIEVLPAVENITLADAETINEITANFEQLGILHLQLIRPATIETLQAAQQALAPLVNEAKAQAQPVIDLIDTLPAKANLALTDKSAVFAAKEAFDALAEEHQAYVTNAQTLHDALSLLDELQTALNHLSVTTVIDQINALTTADSVTLKDETSILAAQAAYDALDETLKAEVTNADFLTTLAQVLEELRAAAAKFQTEIQAVMDFIAALPAIENVALEDESQLIEAQNAFDALTADQKELVTNKDILPTITAQIAVLKLARDNAAAAAKVDAAIEQLPSTVTLTDAEKIKETRALFTALTPEQQTLVTALAQLVDAEAQLTLLNSVVEKPEVTEPEIVQPETNNNNRPSDRDDDNDDESASSNASSNTNSSANTGSTGSSNSGGGGGSAATPTESPVTNTETPTTNMNTVPATTASAPIREVAVNIATNTVNIAVEGNTSTMAVAITPEVLATIQEQASEAVVIQNDNNISMEVPTAVFTENVLNDSEIYLEVQAQPKGKDTKIKFMLKEKFKDGTERTIPLGNKYIKVKFPLNIFKQNEPVASLTRIAQDEAGVILRVVDGEYKAVPHQIKNGEVSIYANANNEYVYSTDVVTFADIEQLANKADIEFLASRYVVNGTSDTTFEPNKSITRAQFGAMIARALNLTPTTETYYADTKGQWYEADIQALYEAGITNAPGNFNPGATLSREHAAVFMHRVMSYIQKENVPTATATAYADQDQINASYAQEIATLNSLGIMQGKEGNVFDPKGNLTRAQMAKVLRKTLEAIDMM